MCHNICILHLLLVMALCVFTEQNTHKIMKMHGHRRMKLSTSAFANNTHASDGSMPNNGGGTENEDPEVRKERLTAIWKQEVRDFSSAFNKVLTHTLLLATGPGHPWGMVTTVVMYATGKMNLDGQGGKKDIWSQLQDRVKVEV